MRENVKKVNKDIFFLALMTAISASLYVFETLLPRPLPFMKIGLSNIIVLLLVFTCLTKQAMIVAIAKSALGAFFTGTLFSPTFILSFVGTLCATLMMIFAVKLSKSITIFGTSIIGSWTHLVAQLLLVRFFIIKNATIFSLYPVIAISSIVAGSITALVAFYFMKHIDLRSIYVEAHS